MRTRFWIPADLNLIGNSTEKIFGWSSLPLTESDLTDKFTKAQKLGYSEITLPLSLCMKLQIPAVLRGLSQTRLKLSVILTDRQFFTEKLGDIQDVPKTLILTDSLLWPRLSHREAHSQFEEIVLPIENIFEAQEQINLIPKEIRSLIRFYVPVGTEDQESAIRTDLVFRLISKKWKRISGFSMQPLRDWENWETRVPSAEAFEPLIQPLWDQRINKSPAISVVIPTYNQVDGLSLCLKSLAGQSLPQELYEILVVNDGSSDGTIEFLSKWCEQHPEVSVAFIDWPRRQERMPGDHQFRAGRARNLGSQFARGKVLCFLDSDILTPPDFLARQVDLAQNFDVIQTTRENIGIPEDISELDFEFLKKNWLSDQDPYWTKFFRSSDWMSHKDFWKFTCSYALTIKKEKFKEAGLFPKTFIYYGNEDSFLGWKLARNGCRFYLDPRPVLHLMPTKERSEYSLNRKKKEQVLKKSCEIFYLNTLDDKVFETCRWVLKPAWPGLRNWLTQRPELP